MHAPRCHLCVGVVTDCARVDRERVGANEMSSYTVETVVRGYHTYKEVGMPLLDKFYLASRNAAVKCSYAPHFRFSWLRLA